MLGHARTWHGPASGRARKGKPQPQGKQTAKSVPMTPCAGQGRRRGTGASIHVVLGPHLFPFCLWKSPRPSALKLCCCCAVCSGFPFSSRGHSACHDQGLALIVRVQGLAGGGCDVAWLLGVGDQGTGAPFGHRRHRVSSTLFPHDLGNRPHRHSHAPSPCPALGRQCLVP